MTCHARFPVGDPKALLFDIKEAPAGSPSWAGRWDAHLIDRCHHPEHVARFDREVFPDPRTGRWERSQARVARVYCQTIVTFVPSKRSAAVVGTPASTGTRLPPCRRVRTIGPGAGKFGGPRPRHRQRLLHRRYHPEHVAAGDGEVARAEGGGGVGEIPPRHQSRSPPSAGGRSLTLRAWKRPASIPCGGGRNRAANLDARAPIVAGHRAALDFPHAVPQTPEWTGLHTRCDEQEP